MLGVFYVSNNYKQVTPIIKKGMVATNGMAFLPDKKNLQIIN